MSAAASEYQRRVECAIFESILAASRVEGADTLAVCNGEVIRACVTIIAFMAATSRATATPSAAREFIDQIAKQLRRHLAGMKNEELRSPASALAVLSLVNSRGRLNQNTASTSLSMPLG